MSRWPIAIICALSSVAVLNTTLYVLASRSKVPFVTDKPYEESLQYDSRQSQESNVLSEHLLPKVAAIPTEKGSQIVLQFGEHAELVAENVRVTLLRPSGDDTDRKLELVSAAPRTYSAATAPALKNGLWFAQVQFTANGAPYQTRMDIWVGPKT